jgi:hypothetical protein
MQPVLLVSINEHTCLDDQECFFHAQPRKFARGKRYHKRLNPTAAKKPRHVAVGGGCGVTGYFPFSY